MAEARDLAWVSIPFTCAAGIASCIGTSHIGAGIASLGCAAAAIWTSSRKTRSYVSAALLSFLTGLVAGFSPLHISSMLSPLFQEHFLQASMSLSASIQSLDLGDARLNALANALVSGNREWLQPETKEAFRASGASHILALSGMHLGIVYFMLDFILRILGNSRAAKTVRSTSCLALCLLYCAITGWGPSITRAMIFIIIRETGHLSQQRRYSAPNCLLAALAIQLFIDPGAIFSTGFQLSYLAMCGITWILPPLKFLWQGEDGAMHRIWNLASTSIACQMATAPLVYLRFHSLPRHFLISNLVSLPLAWGSVISTLLCTAYNLVWGECRILNGICSFFLSALLQTMEIVSEL